MPKKCTLRETNNYIISYTTPDGRNTWYEVVGAKLAVEEYRYARKLYGDNVRISKVVINYGEEI